MSSFDDLSLANFSNLITSICRDFFVDDPADIQKVAELLLQRGTFMEWFGDRYNLLATVEGDVDVGGKKLLESPLVPKNVTLAVTLPLQAQSLIIDANSDFSIQFIPGNIMPHGKSYCQRILNTRRVHAMLDHKAGPFGDIGGNYAAYAAQSSRLCAHCCTFLDSAREGHRFTQRSVNMEAEELRGDFCVDGALRCEKYFAQAVSINVFPDIVKEDIPQIMHVHGTEMWYGTFHYSPEVLLEDVGMLPIIDMIWEKDHLADTITFYFENDSSEPYVHKLSEYMKYTTSWSLAHPSGFTVRYDIVYVGGGDALYRIVKLKTNTLGAQESVSEFAYVPHEQSMLVSTFRYDIGSNLPVDDSEAYVKQNLKMPRSLFEYLYKFGMSNDTSNPNKPLTFADMRSQAHTYNHTRRINNVPITGDFKLDAKSLESAALAVYGVVVYELAVETAKTKTAMSLMQSIQHRAGAENTFKLLAKAVGYTVVWPVLYACQYASVAADVIALHLRDVIANDIKRATIISAPTYFQLPDVVHVGGNEVDQYSTRFEDPFEAYPFSSHEIVNHALVLEVFGDLLTEDQRVELQRRVDLQIVVDETLCTDLALRESSVDTVEDEHIDLMSMNVDEFMDYRVKFSQQMVVSDTPGHVVDAQRVAENLVDKIQEYGLYSHELALMNASDVCTLMDRTNVFGNVKTSALHAENQSGDCDASYIGISGEGELIGPLRDKYNVVFDPYCIHDNPLRRMLKVFAKPGEHSTRYFVKNHLGDKVFVTKQCEIFNSHDLGAKAVAVAKQMNALIKRNIALKTFKELALINGVPGCGKTHEIITSFSSEDMIVSTVRKTADSTRRKMLDSGKYPVDVLANRVKTVDSAILASKLEAAAVLWVDEGLMASAGSIVLVAYLTRAKRVVVYGDTGQIDFIDRSSSLGLLKFPVIVCWSSIEYRNVSARCPADTMFMLSLDPAYADRELRTMSPVMRSLSVVSVPDATNAYFTVAIPETVYLTMLRADKGKLLKGDGFVDGKMHVNGSPVLTVHESQGETYKDVALARIHAFDVKLFGSSAHSVVATSRHTHSFVYYHTKNSNDEVYRRVVAAMQATDEQLRALMIETPKWLEKSYPEYFPQAAVAA